MCQLTKPVNSELKIQKKKKKSVLLNYLSWSVFALCRGRPDIMGTITVDQLSWQAPACIVLLCHTTVTHTSDASAGSDCCVAQNEVQLAKHGCLLLLSHRNLVSQKYPQRGGCCALGALEGSSLVQEDDQMCLILCELTMVCWWNDLGRC